jgi:hypothetical protein
MKNSLFVIVLLVMSAMIFAQTADSSKHCKKDKNKDEIKAVFNQPTRGGFFALYGEVTNITDRQVLMAGMRFGKKPDHWFSYGLGGNILASQMSYDNILSNRIVDLKMGYVGMFVEPCLGPKLPFHLSFPILFGAGLAFYTDNEEQNIKENNNWNTVDNDVFYIIEPGAEFELNFTKHTRISLGVKYRYTSDLQLLNTKEDAFNGLLYGLTLKFGKF